MAKTSKPPPTEAGLLSDAQHLELYYWLKLNRSFDERIATLYRRGKVPGAAYASTGQEAISVGSAYALGPDDVVGPLIRNSGTILVRGITSYEYLANFCAKATGPTRGRDGNNHLGDIKRGIIAPISMLGAMIPTLSGCALAFKLRGEPRVALTYIGDGGTSTGEFHEGLNMAAVMKLPFVLIVENNQYAYSTPTASQTRLTDLAVKAAGYGIPGVIVDGNDVVEVFRVTREAVEHARAGEGPTLIEAKTMRMKGHAEHDDARYVPKALLEEWRAKDPIDRQRRRLLTEKRATQAQIEAVDERVRHELDAAEERALGDPDPIAETASEGVWAP